MLELTFYKGKLQPKVATFEKQTKEHKRAQKNE